MEGGAAEVGESQMDITLTFEEWKANKRVTGEESKLNLPFQRVSLSPFISVTAFMCSVLMTGRQVKREVKNKLSNDSILLHVWHRSTCQSQRNHAEDERWIR